MTNDEKIAIAIEMEKLPRGAQGPFLREQLVKHGLSAKSTPYFMRWRKLHFKKLTGKNYKKLRPPVHDTTPSNPDAPFYAADRDEKLRMLLEYDALPSSAHKKSWRQRNLGVDKSGILTYYRRQFEKDGSLNGAKPLPSVSLVRQPQTDAELLADYESYPGTKKEWCDAHGKSYAAMQTIRNRVARENGNGHHAPAALPSTLSNILPQEAPGPVVSLEDAIGAMQVRIDIYNEVLDHFKRMSRGGRR